MPAIECVAVFQRSVETNKDEFQFEAGNPLSSSSGAHLFQARLSKITQAHEVGDRTVNYQRQIRTSTALRNNTGSICVECYICNTVYDLRLVFTSDGVGVGVGVVSGVVRALMT